MTEHPAETIRRAATLMRERAEAATPGPWVAREMDDDCYVISRGYGLVSTGINENPIGHAMIERDQRDAAHIASWHPLVALAVADWLESRAGDASDAVPANGSWDLSWCDDPAGIEDALTIARAYLGETG